MTPMCCRGNTAGECRADSGSLWLPAAAIRAEERYWFLDAVAVFSCMLIIALLQSFSSTVLLCRTNWEAKHQDSMEKAWMGSYYFCHRRCLCLCMPAGGFGGMSLNLDVVHCSICLPNMFPHLWPMNSLFLYQWSSDSLDKRELAGKLAKLNAIELAKFSRRVTGQPSYPCSL